jgi:cytochrome c553
MNHVMLLGLVSGLLVAGDAVAAPSSNVAWTIETMALVKSGDPEKGKQLSASCAGCHGAEGISANPMWPSTAGQDAAYAYKQLRDYKDQKRVNPIMTGMVIALSDEDMADIAAFYATRPLPGPEGEGGNAAAVKLVKEGDGPRLIPACNACHGAKGEGNKRSHGMPALAGQMPQYLVQTMQAYRSGKRANDVYGVMRAVAKTLTDEEIQGLAKHYAAQDAR